MGAAKKKLYQILLKHVPENAVHYCLDLWTAIPFHFKVTRKRSTKLGDYRYDPRRKSHSITVNVDLNQYSFLITYIHEIAHLLNTERHGRKVPPHGVAWKGCFKELMRPVMTDLIFPHDVLLALQKHMNNPKASTYADSRLVKALRKYDEHEIGLMTLGELKEGDLFEFNKRMYTYLHIRRTRVMCQESESNRKYLISKMAMIRYLESKTE